MIPLGWETFDEMVTDWTYKLVQDLPITGRVPMPPISEGPIRKLYADYDRDCMVRHPKALDKLAVRVCNRMALIYTSTLLLEHSVYHPYMHCALLGLEYTQDHMERLCDYLRDGNGNILISDMLDYVAYDICPPALDYSDPGKQLVSFDRVINFAHYTTDFAFWLFERGSEFLDELGVL